ncbi:unnamed protein product [Rhodiola kirilowii]
MSNAADDEEESLLREIRQSVRAYNLSSQISNNIYHVASYIIKNVTALRLDVPKQAPTGVLDEIEAEGELNFQEFEFEDISNILKEIEHANSTEMDVHAFALSLLNILHKQKEYTMNFILLGPLAAFAMTHGVWLLVLKFICSDSKEEEGIFMVLKTVEELFNSLKKNLEKEETHNNHDFYIYISLLSSIVTKEPRDNWKSMGSLYSLIKAMLEVGSLTHFILKDVYEHDNIPKFLNDQFDSLALLSIYWVASAVFTCSSQCDKLPKNGYVVEDEDSQKLMDICGKLKSIHKRLMKIESSGKQYMDDEKIADVYQIPNAKIGRSYYALMALIDLPAESEDLKIFRCNRKDMALYVAKVKESKILLLLISGLDISFNEINFLKDIYVESKTSVQPEFELIWLPIHFGPWIASLEGQYTKLLQMMPWLTIKDPNVMNERTKKIISDVWKFQKKPIIVVINNDGRVVCPNAIHSMYIWGFKPFPFTRSKERAMWSMGMRLDSLVLGFDPNVASMIEAGKWVVLYGGNDIKWIPKFTNCIGEVSSKLGILIEIIYVGKDREIMSLISTNSPQSYSPGIYKIWYFWTRLESLIVSRYQTFTTASDTTTDTIIQEVKKLLSYASVESWACLSIPSSDLMIHGLGDTMLKGFMEYEEWKQNIHTKEFPKFFQNRIEELGRASDIPTCSRIVLQIDNKDVVQSLNCPDCTHLMEKKIQYRCCHIQDEL